MLYCFILIHMAFFISDDENTRTELLIPSPPPPSPAQECVTASPSQQSCTSPLSPSQRSTPSSPTPMSDDTDTASDEEFPWDGIEGPSHTAVLLSSAFLNGVKLGVLHFLNKVLRRYRKEVCNGCLTEHASQRQHPCLWPMEDAFYRVHFKQLRKRVWNQGFMAAINLYLGYNGIHATYDRIRGAAEMVMHGLKNCDASDIDTMYTEMLEDEPDEDKIDRLKMVEKRWEDEQL